MSTVSIKRLNTIEKIEQFLIKQLPKLAAPESTNPTEQLKASQDFLAAFDNPQEAHRTIHIAGTSGKGTVAYMVDAILRAHSKRTGLLVSPHVYDIRERIQINGQFIPEKHFIGVVNEVVEHFKDKKTTEIPNYYRLMPILGFLATSRHRLDYLVVETGMGGRLDTTNTIERNDKYCVLTQIGLDHTRQLGTTYEQIAAEKVAIVQSGAMVTALRQRQIVNQTFQHVFDEKNATVSWVETTENYLINDMLIALSVVENIAKRDGWRFEDETARTAVRQLYIPGRFEKRLLRNKLVILDGAHNPQKMRALGWRLANEDIAPCTVVLALGKHRDSLGVIESLKPIANRVICTEFFVDEPDIPIRATPCQSLAETATANGLNAEAIKNPLEALRRAVTFSEPVVATGSFYLLGDLDKSL